MYLIKPYNSIGDFELGTSRVIIESRLGETRIDKNPFSEQIQIARYPLGLTIEYKDAKACFIGAIIELKPVLHDFSFENRSLQDILNYFRQFPGVIYTDSSVYVSEYLGITTYFEDSKLLEVGIFAKEHKENMIDGMNTC
ncbi:MAG TPA: hypothetical protein VNT20_18380 [Flavisolibacter sp.]|jgi:hypothetical protein|nr:hypothetical protein [Flavisolibacter sp.]